MSPVTNPCFCTCSLVKFSLNNSYLFCPISYSAESYLISVIFQDKSGALHSLLDFLLIALSFRDNYLPIRHTNQRQDTDWFWLQEQLCPPPSGNPLSLGAGWFHFNILAMRTFPGNLGVIPGDVNPPPPPPEQRYWQNSETANIGLVSSVGRAPARQSGGCRFKSCSRKFFFAHPNFF